MKEIEEVKHEEKTPTINSNLILGNIKFLCHQSSSKRKEFPMKYRVRIVTSSSYFWLLKEAEARNVMGSHEMISILSASESFVEVMFNLFQVLV